MTESPANRGQELDTMDAGDAAPLRITLCIRRVEASVNGPVIQVLERAGHPVVVTKDRQLDLAAGTVLWLQGNANWYPRLCRELAERPRHSRPFVIIWHSEPLPPPKAAGRPLPRLHLREIAKIVLRDRRATDVYTNYFRLRRLAKQGLPDRKSVV